MRQAARGELKPVADSLPIIFFGFGVGLNLAPSLDRRGDMVGEFHPVGADNNTLKKTVGITKMADAQEAHRFDARGIEMEDRPLRSCLSRSPRKTTARSRNTLHRRGRRTTPYARTVA